jgi:nucleoside-diphosphate-sugar epimerase
MTGATGFLGNYILRDLLARGRRVAALVRPPAAESAARLAELMRPLKVDTASEIAAGRLVIVEGALPDRLPAPTWGRTDEFVACAASLQLFSNGNGEPHKTNVEGTRAVLDWVRKHGVRTLHAVSTAYVCGRKPGRILEEFHRPRPEFQTEYEVTKWTAEEMLAEWGARPGNVLTVLRPSFIIGDSQTGYTTQFGGFYQLGRMLAVIRDYYGNGSAKAAKVPLRIPGRPTEPMQNLVPVDFAGAMCAEVICNPARHGRIYHLTDPQPPNWEHFVRFAEKYFNLEGGEFVQGDRLTGPGSEAEELLYQRFELFWPRVRIQPDFDNTNAAAVMRECGLEFPGATYERMARMLDYAVAAKWGARNGRGNGRTHL